MAALALDGFEGLFGVCKTVYLCMQATNKMQQFSFIDLFIDLFESALHISGDKLAHLQEHF